MKSAILFFFAITMAFAAGCLAMRYGAKHPTQPTAAQYLVSAAYEARDGRQAYGEWTVTFTGKMDIAGIKETIIKQRDIQSTNQIVILAISEIPDTTK